MEGWALFWMIVLFTALGLFAVMSLWVIAYGYRDIKLMFAELRRQGDMREAAKSRRRPGDGPGA